MFASQLLKVLETIPADESYETRLFDSLALKLTMKENQNEISCLSNGFEKKADPSVINTEDGNDGNASWNPFLSDCTEVVDRSSDSNNKEVTDGEKLLDQEEPFCHSNGCKRDTYTNSCEKEVAEDSETSYTSISQLIESNSLSQTDCYADQSVKEVSEDTVCYSDSIIKDICVDEGSPGRERVLIQNDKEDHVGGFFSQHSEDRHNGTVDDIEDSRVEHMRNCVLGEDDGTKEVDVATCLLNDSKSSAEDSVEDVTTNVLGSGNLKQMSEAIWITAEKAEDDISEDESESSSRYSSQESLEDDQQHTSKDAKIDEVPSVEAILVSLAGAFASDDPKKNVTESKSLYDSKVDGGAITFDINSSNKDGGAENSHGESENAKLDISEDKPGAILPNRLSNAEKSDDEPKSLASLLQHGIGESSFAAIGPGLVTFSGPMVPYSGSISHRSDSSTTSTRSFAFPVLQTDWNSSPVRMAKAERGRFWKHRSWRQGLLCCKF